MKPQKIQVKICRVCLSKKILPLGITKKFYLLNVDQTVTLSYKICSNCQFIFHGEYVGDKFLEEYYKQSPMLRRKNLTQQERDQYQQQSSFITDHAKIDGASVLEIGADTGTFLTHLHDKYACEVYFDELSEEAKQIMLAQETLQDFHSQEPGKKVDLVVLRHIVEHIFDLDSFLKQVKSSLKEEGMVFIEIPDWSYLDSHTDPFIFEHLNQFNSYNLMLLLKRCGFQCEALQKCIQPDYLNTPNHFMRLLAKPDSLAPPGDSRIVEDFQQYYQDHFEVGNTAINEILSKLGKRKTIALYPASHQTFMALNETNLPTSKVIGIFDIDPKKHGKKIQGFEVFPADKLKELKPDIIFLFTQGAFEYEIKGYFKSLGLASQVITLGELLKKT